MKKAMMIETLEALRDNAEGCVHIWEEDGNEIMAAKKISEWLTLDMVVRMMRDDRFAKTMRTIFFTEDGMRK